MMSTDDLVPPAEGRAWYAVRTKPHKERIAVANYRNQGLEVYLPLMRTVRKHARRREEVLRPVFPGYLFLHLAPAERNWTAISSTRGVIGPVCFGDSYVSVPAWIIEGLRAKEDEAGVIAPGCFQRPKLASGMEVEVELDGGGSAKGFFCSFHGEENVVILLEILQRQVKTTLPLDRIKPV